MEWDRHYFPFPLTNPRASVSDVLRMAVGAMAPWPQNAVVSISSARAGGLCGLVGYAGFAMTEVPRYLTCVSYHVAHGKVTTRVTPNEAHTVL